MNAGTVGKGVRPNHSLGARDGNPLMAATMRLVLTSSFVRIPVPAPEKKSGRECSAMTTSSRAVFPARSPMPLMVPSHLLRPGTDGSQ